MRTKYFVLIAAVMLITLGSQAAAQMWTNGFERSDTNPKIRNNFFDYQKSFNDYWGSKNITPKTPKNERGGWMQFKRWEWFWGQRTFPTGEFPDPMHTYNEYLKLRNRKDINPEKLQTAGWQSLGPVSSTGGYAGLGRLNCVEEDPDYNGTTNKTIWVGSASGGLWKSTDDGANWSGITDNLPVLGVNEICINPQNKNIMYLATGDGDHSDTYSVGVLKTTDGGANWNTTGLNWAVTQTSLIRKLIMHPTDYNILFAATSAGVYRTTDGGTNWTLMSIPLTSSSGGYWDIEFKPSHPNTIYATSTWEIARTTNGGTNWTILGSNLPDWGANVYRAEIAVTPHDTNYIYAVYGYRNYSGGNSSNNSGLYGVYKSANGGTDWTEVLNWDDNGLNLLGWQSDGSDMGGQAWYDLAIAVSPSNKNYIFVGGVNVWFSPDAGSNWDCVAHWYGQNNVPAVHADHHHLHFAGTSNRLYAGHDGGINRTTNNGTNWSWIGTGLKITQFYRLGVSQTYSPLVIGGSQDNGTKLKINTNWYDVIGGDGMECIIDYSDSSYIYGEIYYGRIFRSTNAGNTFDEISKPNESGDWVTPYVLHPTNPSIIYAGYKNVWKSANRGDSWTAISNFSSGTLTVLHVAPSNPNYIYAGYSNSLKYTSNGGTNWNNISLPSSQALVYMAVHPDNPNRIWAAFSGYSSGQKVYYSTNNGTAWTNVSGNLPNIPVNCIVFENESANRIYAGTDLGVFYLDDDTQGSWIEFNTSLPNVVVSELEIQYEDGLIFAATFGRGIWSAALPGAYGELAAPVLNSPANNAVNVAINSNLTWDSVQTADNYIIQISLNSNFSTTLANVTQSGTSYALSNISPAYSTVYYWRTRAKRGNEEGPWATARSFTTEPIPLVAPVLINPADNAANLAINSNLTWNTVQGADNYIIQISLNSNFSTTLANVTQSGTSYALSNISPAYSTVYYWRTRAKRGSEEGPLATARSFTTEPIPLVAPVLTNPADNTVNAAINSNLTWNSVQGADNYIIQISLNSNFSTTLANVTQSGTSYSLSNISPAYSTVYYWRTRAKRGSEEGPLATARSFTTEPIPLIAPVLTNPADNAVNVAINSNLTWNSVQGADNYIIQISLNSNFSPTLANVTQSGTSYALSNISPAYSTVYYWRVRAKRGSEEGPLATARSFTTEPIPLVVPVLISPADNALKVHQDAFLVWGAVNGADSYILQISTLSDFSSLIFNQNIGDFVSYDLSPTNLNFNTSYYWRVRAVRNSDPGPFSAGFKFTIRKFLETPNPVYPASMAQNIMDIEFIEWSAVEDADKYHLQLSESSDFSVVYYENANIIPVKFLISTAGLTTNHGFFWRVRAINYLETGNWSTTRSFTTYPKTTHCDAKALSCAEFMSSLSFAGLSYSSSCNWGYTDRYSSQTATVTKLQQYAFSLTGNSTTVNTNCRLWIDWNGDNDFIDDGESIVLSGSPGFGPYTKNITIPFTAITGKVRARILITGGSVDSPCGIINNGDVEDFALNILMPVTNPPALISPLNNAVDLEPLVQFVWNDVQDAVNYHLQISESQAFGSIVYESSTALTSLTVPQGTLSYRKTYYWRVNGTANQVTSDYSSVRKFNTKLTVPDSWAFTPNTGKSSTIRVPAAINPIVGERTIVSGDAVGLFYDVNGLEVCAGYGIWNGNTLDITVWGDNVNTQQKDGYATSETYKFKMWDSMLDLIYTADATYDSGPSVFTNNTLSVLSSLESNIRFHNINLSVGWNMISTYIIPINQSMPAVWADIASNVTLVKNGLGKSYIPAYNINNIGNWNLYHGYQVHIREASVLEMSGTEAVPLNEPIILSTGWSLISYIRKTNLSAVTAFATLTNTGGLKLAKNNQGKTYIPEYNINGIGNLVPGQGYQVYINHADTLIYPKNDQQKSAMSNQIYTPTDAEILAPELQNTGSNMTLIIEFENSDERFDIGVYNSHNLLIGAGRIIGDKSFVTIWDYDRLTDENPDHGKLTVKAYDKVAGIYSDVTVSFINEYFSKQNVSVLSYKTDAVYFAKAAINFDASTASISSNPNPFSDRCEVTVYIPVNSGFVIRMYNAAGAEVFSAEPNRQSAGKHIFNIDAGVLSSGEYTLILNYDGKSISKKVMLSR